MIITVSVGVKFRFQYQVNLALSWRRPLSYRNQSNLLTCIPPEITRKPLYFVMISGRIEVNWFPSNSLNIRSETSFTLFYKNHSLTVVKVVATIKLCFWSKTKQILDFDQNGFDKSRRKMLFWNVFLVSRELWVECNNVNWSMIKWVAQLIYGKFFWLFLPSLFTIIFKKYWKLSKYITKTMPVKIFC